MSLSAEAEKFVRRISKYEQNNVGIAAAELAPLYGFGSASNFDVLARLRAQTVFTSPQIKAPLREFLDAFAQGR